MTWTSHECYHNFSSIVFHAFQTHGDLINEQTTTTKIHSPFDTASAGARNFFKVNLQGKSRLEFQGKILLVYSARL